MKKPFNLRLNVMLKNSHYQGLYSLKSHISILKDRDWLRKHAESVLKDGVNLVVEISGEIFELKRNMVVKLFGWRNTPSKMLSPFMHSRATNSWDNAHWLLRNKIQTPRPISVYTQRQFGIIKENFFICEAIHHHNNAREIVQHDNLDLGTKVHLVELLASIVQRIHNTKMTYNDLNLSNFLVQDYRPEKIFLIDQNRAKRWLVLPRSRRMNDIARMNLCTCNTLTDDHFCFLEVFLRAYSGERYKSDKILLKTSMRKRFFHKELKSIRNRLYR
ncbi:MAG: hypothetical protein IIA61_09325 [Candidatus Marinimicrobia bacterium]|nr:hypothetical protein [Candidatus Neomarinimicrobiota bacterium]